MLVVQVFPHNGGVSQTYTFPHDCVPKVLQCGVLKIYEPGDVEVPDLGQAEGEEIGVTPDYLIAVFHSNYIVTWNNQ